MKKAKAILLLSGGLDSMLVGAILKRENIDVLAVRFVTGLEYPVIKNELMNIHYDDPAKKAADFLNIPIRFVSLKDKYIDMFLNPKYGYGSSINPCLDCHILMLKTAKKIMEEEGFDFIATGEVKGQRPMSQKSQDLINSIRESGLEGKLLRPLSAKLLPITIAESEGLINRENLYDIYGRSRQVQMELAKEFGIDDYPIPSGGCCSIVDKNYGRRYEELVSHNGREIINMELMQYLAIGRHIRIDNNAKLILGRNENENDALEKRERKNAITFRPNYNKGPFGYLELYGEVENIKEAVLKSANIMGYFSKEDTETLSITVSYSNDEKDIIEIDNKNLKRRNLHRYYNMNEYNSKKRYLGEFYTPLIFAKKSLEYINDVISIDELKSGNYRIWDMASGTGNLEYYLDKELYKYLYMSTIDENDIDYCKEKFKEACLFQYDYLNDDIVVSENIFDYKKLPKKLIKDLNNKNLKWLIFINPPYATSQVAGTNSKSKKNVSISKIRDIMHSEKLGESSRELYAQFMFRIYREFLDREVYLAIFSKTNYIKSNNNEKFRNNVCNYKFMNGFIFSSSNFDNTSKTTPFPVSFIIWKVSKLFNIKKENIVLDILDDDGELKTKKNYSVVSREELLNKWIKRIRTTSSFVPLSSAIVVKENGKDIRNKICDGFIGSLMSCGSDLQKQNLTAIFSAPQASAGSLSITKENFEKAMIIHAVRRTVKVNWLNGSDQFIIPKKTFSDDFKNDCIVWSLFSTSNQTSAMDNIYYNNKYYKIINQFYPFDYREVFCNNSFFSYDGESRFVCDYLKNISQTKEAKDLIDISKELYKYFYSNVEKVNTNKFKISLWDSGFWQIRKSLKDASLALDILKEIKIKRNILRENILKEIDNFVS